MSQVIADDFRIEKLRKLLECKFVESSQQLSTITNRNVNTATGNILTLREALKKYGVWHIRDCMEYGSSIIN